MTQAPGYVGLPLQITVASPPLRGVTGISVTTSAPGYSAATTVGACSASGCNIVAQAPPDYVRVQVSLIDSHFAPVISGEFHAEADEAGAPVPVSFGGSPASVDLSAEPAEFKAGATGRATLRAIAYDAQGRRIVGSMPFPSPIAVSSSSSAAQLLRSSLTSPDDTIAVTFDGTGSGDVTFSGAVSGAAVESVQVPIAVSDTANANGEQYGDLVPASQEQLAAAAATRRIATVTAVDLRKYLPPVADQGQTKMCAVFSAVYMIRTELEKIQRLTERR